MKCDKEDLFKLGRLVTCSKCGWYNVWPKKELKITELTWTEYQTKKSQLAEIVDGTDLLQNFGK